MIVFTWNVIDIIYDWYLLIFKVSTNDVDSMTLFALFHPTLWYVVHFLNEVISGNQHDIGMWTEQNICCLMNKLILDLRELRLYMTLSTL